MGRGPAGGLRLAPDLDAAYAVVYYTLMSMGLMTLGYLVHTLREKKSRTPSWRWSFRRLRGHRLRLLCGDPPAPAGIFQETMRGGRTELTNHTNKTESKDGLSKDYAFGYSYGLGETFTVLVPHMFGGGSDATKWWGIILIWPISSAKN